MFHLQCDLGSPCSRHLSTVAPEDVWLLQSKIFSLWTTLFLYWSTFVGAIEKLSSAALLMSYILPTWSHENTYLCALSIRHRFTYLTALFTAVSKRNVHWVVLKYRLITWTLACFYYVDIGTYCCFFYYVATGTYCGGSEFKYPGSVPKS